MSRVRGSLDIACPVEVVFDAVADQRNEPSYNPAMTHANKVTPGPIAVGTTFEATVMSRGSPRPVTIEYTGFERPHRIHSRSVMEGATVDGHIQCDPTPAGTRFSWDWTTWRTPPAQGGRSESTGLFGTHGLPAAGPWDPHLNRIGVPLTTLGLAPRDAVSGAEPFLP
ncbi:MAG: hypothetical protein K0R30_3077 [Ornithinibacter sp.]|nr:hypothetical protein [Ornithinibacter sp.]